MICAGTLEWDSSYQKEIFKGTAWSAVVTALLAGYVADRTSAKWLLQIGVVFFIVCSVVFPFLALNVGFAAALASRIVMGIGEGVILPAINVMITSWFPPVERSTAAAINTAGNQIAGFLGSPLAAYLCASSWKWPSVFYLSISISRIAGVIWSIFWLLTVTDNPSESKLMTTRERRYLEATLFKRATRKKRDTADYGDVISDIDIVIHNAYFKLQKVKVPWKKVFTSKPIWAIFISQFAAHFIFFFVQSYTPTYFKEVLFMKLTDNGIYSALPNLTLCVSKILWGVAMDKLKEKQIVTPTAGCKISQRLVWTTSVSMAILLAALAMFVDCTRPMLAVVLLCIFGVAFSTTVSGFFTALLSVAPPFVGTLSSISFFFGIIGQLLAPDLVAYIDKHGTVEEWRIIFLIMASVSLVAGVVFGLYGSADIQSWAVTDAADPAKNKQLLSIEKEKSPTNPLVQKAEEEL
uniref:MFS domain-containing protein n=1 Tax=Syphacia muris TaxID=451379 RepID=A0A0N5AUK4_9BILA